MTLSRLSQFTYIGSFSRFFLYILEFGCRCMYLDQAQLRNSIAAKPHFRTAFDNQECDVRRLLPLLFRVLPVNEGQEIVRQRLRMMCQIGLNRHFPLLIGRGECMCARPSIFCFGDSFLESRFPFNNLYFCSALCCCF